MSAYAFWSAVGSLWFLFVLVPMVAAAVIKDHVRAAAHRARMSDANIKRLERELYPDRYFDWYPDEKPVVSSGLGAQIRYLQGNVAAVQAQQEAVAKLPVVVAPPGAIYQVQPGSHQLLELQPNTYAKVLDHFMRGVEP